MAHTKCTECTQNCRRINSRCSKLLVSAFICIFSTVLGSYGPTKGIFVMSKKKKKNFFFGSGQPDSGSGQPDSGSGQGSGQADP